MTEEEAMFDTSMKKKKKKKKTPFDLDAVMAEGSGTAAPEEPASGTAAPDAANNAAPEPPAPEPDDDDFSSMKKKKKKKKVIDMSELEEALPASEEKGGEDTAPAGDDLGEEDLDFTLPSKKKKKKKVKLEDKMLDDAEAADEANKSKSNGQAWSDTDRDYTYDELLKRVFDIMRVKKPEMVAGEKKKFVLKPPQVMRVGTKKTSFANFADICRMLHRQPDHLLAFLLAELGTSGSVDGNNQLIIKGRFLQKQIENVLRSYIREYVTCQTCKSPDTILQKDTRLFFVQCETCGSRCSVASIKSGFQAVTGRRAAMRARQT